VRTRLDLAIAEVEADRAADRARRVFDRELEGCLSLPTRRAEVTRALRVTSIGAGLC
jgi:peptide deformylase